jgi:hypothetical protein
MRYLKFNSAPAIFYVDDKKDYMASAYLGVNPESAYSFKLGLYHEKDEIPFVSWEGCDLEDPVVNEPEEGEEGCCITSLLVEIHPNSKKGGSVIVALRGVQHKIIWGFCPNLQIADFQGNLAEDIGGELVEKFDSDEEMKCAAEKVALQVSLKDAPLSLRAKRESEIKKLAEKMKRIAGV